MSESVIIDKIYEKFKKLKEEAAEDCKFDRGQMDSSFDNTAKLMKWINKKTEWARVLRAFDLERKEKYRASYEFYVKDFPMKLNGKEEYQMFIESDPAYMDIHHKYLVAKEIVTYIDSVIDTLKARAWEVKGYLEWLKFSNGQ